MVISEIPLPPSAVEEGRKITLYNMQMLVITMYEDIRHFVNRMDIIEETRTTSPTIEDRVQMTNNGFNLIETYMELFENHADTASLHNMMF